MAKQPFESHRLPPALTRVFAWVCIITLGIALSSCGFFKKKDVVVEPKPVEKPVVVHTTPAPTPKPTPYIKRGFPMPERGQSKSQVYDKFGQAEREYGPTGTPPIYYWEYTDFTVYFEGDYVIHAVSNYESQFNEKLITR